MLPKEPTSGPHAFVGRTSEIAAIRSDCESAAAGRGRVVLVEGETGIGKTRLVTEGLAGQFTSVRWGSAEELDGHTPFGVIVDALGIDLRAARLGRLLLSSAGEPGPRSGNVEFRVAEALLTQIEDHCSNGTVALVLEDLHWADPSSLVFLYRLARRAQQLPLLVVVTRRPAPEQPVLDRVISRLAEGAARRIPLGPLGAEEIQAMAASALGGVPGPGLLAHLRRASGNPLFVSELLAGLLRGDSLVRDAGGDVNLAPGVVPASLGTLVLDRLSFLPAETIEVLRLAALLGSGFEVTHLCRMLTLSAVTVFIRLRPALLSGVLEDSGDRFVFRHDVIREALYLDIPEPLRNRLHVEVAHSLVEADAAPERVAEHLLRGASRDPASVGALRTVATQLVDRAPGLAADLLALAHGLSTTADERNALLAERVRALWRAGRLPEAGRICRTVLARRSDPWTRLYLVQVLTAQGRWDEALAAIVEGLAAGTASAVVRARLLAWRAWVRVHLGELAGADDEAVSAQRAAEEAGDRLGSVLAVITRASAARLGGRAADAIELGREALRLEREPGGGRDYFPVDLVMAEVFLSAGLLDEGIAATGRALAACDERGSRWELPRCHWVAATGWFMAGQWDDALAELETAATLADEFGTRPGTSWGHAIAALIALHRGDLAGMNKALGEAEQENARGGPRHRRDRVLWVRGLAAEAAGDVPAAVTLIREAWDVCTGAGLVAMLPALAPDLVRLSLAAGDRHGAHAVAAVLEGTAAANGTTMMEAAVARCRGLLGDDPVALLESARLSEKIGRPLEAGQATEEAAVVLARQGHASEARIQIESALRHYSALGAAHDAARAESRLRELGVRRGRQGPRRRPRYGWEGLTETELTVTALVAEGLSNPQIAERLFVSRHTVHTHVSHILAKLGLSSRVELATEALRRSR